MRESPREMMQGEAPISPRDSTGNRMISRLKENLMDYRTMTINIMEERYQLQCLALAIGLPKIQPPLRSFFITIIFEMAEKTPKPQIRDCLTPP